MTSPDKRFSGTAALSEAVLQRSDVTIRPGPTAGDIIASGSLDMLTSPLLLLALTAALATRPERIRLDMRGVHFIDASTVRVLIQAWRDATAAGSDLRVAGANGIVRRVLELTGVWPLLAEEAT